MNWNLNDLTSSEKLWIWRYRQLSEKIKVGSRMNQEEAARRLAIPYSRYNNAENGRLPERDIKSILATAYAEELAPLTLGEKCALARRRSGRRLNDLVKVLNITRIGFLKQEHQGAANLVRYWQSFGFLF